MAYNACALVTHIHPNYSRHASHRQPGISIVNSHCNTQEKDYHRTCNQYQGYIDGVERKVMVCLFHLFKSSVLLKASSSSSSSSSSSFGCCHSGVATADVFKHPHGRFGSVFTPDALPDATY